MGNRRVVWGHDCALGVTHPGPSTSVRSGSWAEAGTSPENPLLDREGWNLLFSDTVDETSHPTSVQVENSCVPSATT